MSKKIYTVGGFSNYTNWMDGEEVEDIKDADLVVFTGGEDVCPALYNQKCHRTTHFNIHRDNYELQAYKIALKLGKKIWGTCRGTQLLGAMNNAILIQDLHHPYNHMMETADGENILINSLHHQAVFPWKLQKQKFQVLGWSNNDFNFKSVSLISKTLLLRKK